MASIYKKIKEIAERKKIQQKDIALGMEVGINTVNNWFQEKTSMKAEQVPQIARILRVPISSLFDQTEDLKTLEEPLVEYGAKALLEQKDETIKAKDEIIEMLKGQVDFLKTQLEQ